MHARLIIAATAALLALAAPAAAELQDEVVDLPSSSEAIGQQGLSPPISPAR